MSFAYPHISLVAILVAAVVQFVLGFLWYSGMTPTGKRWASEMGMAGAQGTPGVEMLIFPVGSVLAAWAVAVVVGWSGADGAMDGMRAAWVVAAAVAAQVVASGVATGKATLVLHAINVGYLVVGYALMGAIVAALS